MTEPKKRGKKGLGSVVVRSGKLWAQWSSRDPQTGARRQHRAGPFRTETEARRRLIAELGKVNDGTFVAPPKPRLLGEVLDAWLASKTEVRPTTLEGYRVAVESWLKPRLGGTKVPALTEAQVRDALADLAARGGRGGRPLSPRSCQLAVVVLRMALSWAMEQGWAVRNVAARAKVKTTRTRMRSWTAEEARRFLLSAADDRLIALYTLLVTRGLRRGEAVGLRWDAVDLDAGWAMIVETSVLVGGKATVSQPKTTAGVRRIPLDPALVDVLRGHRRRQLEDRLRAGTAWAESGYVFTDELGQQIKPDHVSDRFAKLCAKAAVPTIRTHDLRHTAASLMLAGGEQVKVVSEMLGHADTRITSEIYQHVLPGMAEAAGARLSGLVL